ncbi:hypothetical protein LTS14_008647 [Recurvomyces mirabilis]|uniref:uncharacterized protein n=1 Tax=Recurvomyces mirabilis TaxID=574656 RepID=UPI002DE1E147|nr:hypothetical protein LTS14_008647 [Recurvomyces mirabilis]
MASDLDQLVDMGFDREKSEFAIKQGGNITGAIDWLDKNADKSIEDIKEEQAAAAGDAADPGATAMSMFHAEKTGHDDFSESTEEIAPLTEDEKKQRLQELREKLAAKRAGMADVDKAEKKRNDEIRKKQSKETDDVKEQLQAKEQIKEAQKKRQEKLDDVAAKKRIKDKIEADKAARRHKQEEEKAMRANPDAFNPGAPSAGGSALAAAQQPAKAASAHHSEARLRLQTPGGNVMKTFPAETTLVEVAQALEQENGTQAKTFTMNMPRKVFDFDDFGMTLKEAGLVPSAVLIVG